MNFAHGYQDYVIAGQRLTSTWTLTVKHFCLYSCASPSLLRHLQPAACSTASIFCCTKARFPSKRNASDCVWMETGLNLSLVYVLQFLNATHPVELPPDLEYSVKERRVLRYCLVAINLHYQCNTSNTVSRAAWRITCNLYIVIYGIVKDFVVQLYIFRAFLVIIIIIIIIIRLNFSTRISTSIPILTFSMTVCSVTRVLC